jgi:hypothetical protein
MYTFSNSPFVNNETTKASLKMVLISKLNLWLEMKLHENLKMLPPIREGSHSSFVEERVVTPHMLRVKVLLHVQKFRTKDMRIS